MKNCASYQKNIAYTNALVAQRNLDADLFSVYKRLSIRWQESCAVKVTVGKIDPEIKFKVIAANEAVN